MIPLNPIEDQNAMKALYSRCVEKCCEEFQLTRMELDILLFLANNPIYDTAQEIVKMRALAKSQVSEAVKQLESRGLLVRFFQEGNRKSMHLRLCEAAMPAVEAGRVCQEQFLNILLTGIPEEDLAVMQRCTEKIRENIRHHREEGMKDAF